MVGKTTTYHLILQVFMLWKTTTSTCYLWYLCCEKQPQALVTSGIYAVKNNHYHLLPQVFMVGKKTHYHLIPQVFMPGKTTTTNFMLWKTTTTTCYLKYLCCEKQPQAFISASKYAVWKQPQALINHKYLCCEKQPQTFINHNYLCCEKTSKNAVKNNQYGHWCCENNH